MVTEILPECIEDVVGPVTDVVIDTTMSLPTPPIMVVGEVSSKGHQEAVATEAGSSLGLGASAPTQLEEMSLLGFT